MKITPYIKNAKKHSLKQIEQVAGSIKEFGMNQPIIVDKKGVIVVGHGRFEACKHLGWSDEEILKHVKVIDLPQEKINAYRLADNKLNESDWDIRLVIEELKELSVPLIDLTGFSKSLLENVMVIDNPMEEWTDMPEFMSDDKTSFRHVIVHFKDAEKAKEFFRLINQKDTGKTKSLWFPEEENMDTESKRYV